MTDDLRVHTKDDGLLLIEKDGTARFLTFWERVRYRLFNTLPGKSMKR